jgi:hypothetical protein
MEFFYIISRTITKTVHSVAEQYILIIMLLIYSTKNTLLAVTVEDMPGVIHLSHMMTLSLFHFATSR